MDLFSKEYQDHVQKMRKKFFQAGSAEGITGVRPEILSCWEVAYANEVRPENARKDIASPEEFTAALADSAELLAVAEPYMQLLHSFLEPDSFWVGLMDRNGVIVRLVGSPLMLRVAKSTELMEGSYRGDTSYPGMYSTCWKLDRPFRIVSGEHPSIIDDGLAGAAAPIHDRSTGKSLGVIGISGYFEKSHGHTLGLTIMAAEAISQQLELRKQNADIQASNQMLNTAFDAVDTGAVFFREDGTISAANHHAMELLCGAGTDRERFTKEKIFHYFGNVLTEERLEQIKNHLQEQGIFSCEVVPTRKYSPVRCSIRRTTDEPAGYFMQVQKSDELNKSIADAAFSQPLFSFGDIIGESEAVRAAKKAAQIAAKHSLHVLITGDSGTGKEVLAQAIHNSSSRVGKPFVTVNCGVLPKALIANELFGCEATAETEGQIDSYIGKFELANGGTLFLDEISDIPYELQADLLRVLRNQEILRNGGKTTVKLDVRVIVATNQDLEKCVREKTFREDLYYRLNVLTIRMPALRDRSEDILPLSLHFLGKYGQTFDKRISAVSEDALENMKQYAWPGNIRELESVMERAVLVCESTTIEPQDLPEQLRGISRSGESAGQGSRVMPVRTIKRENFSEEGETFLNLLRKHQGNISEVARELGVSRPTIYRKMKKYGIDPTEKWLFV